MSMTRALLLAAIASVTLLVLSLLVDLPWWLPIAFVLSFFVYAALLKMMAAISLAAWERGLRIRVMRGESSARPGDWIPERTLASWYYSKGVLFERAAALLEALERRAVSSACLVEAYRSAPIVDKPRLALLIWSSIKKRPADEVSPPSDYASVLEHALRARDPPFNLYEDYADLLFDRGLFKEADENYRRALERTSTESRRCKLFCRLALTCAKDHRYGAADAALHEARELIPTGDSGFQALYHRTESEIADGKALLRIIP
jgi:tetratricopeptide (TPR) repeat protein